MNAPDAYVPPPSTQRVGATPCPRRDRADGDRRSRRPAGDAPSGGGRLLLQHADKDIALQKTALVLLRKAVDPREASGSDLAYLTDRVRLAEGKLQVYGTQLQYDARGCASPKPSEYPPLRSTLDVQLSGWSRWARISRRQ